MNAAKKHLRESSAWGAYLDHIGKTCRAQASLGELPDMGAFTPARYYNLQIRKTNSVQESVKHDISPIANRTRSETAIAGKMTTLRFLDSRPATPVNNGSGLDLSTLQESLPTRDNVESENSSFSSQDSPLTRKSKPVIPATGPTGSDSEREQIGDEEPTPLRSTETVSDGSPGHASNDSSSDSEQSTEESLATHSIGNASAAAILHPPTEDEQTVNMGLLLFLLALCAHCPLATAE